MSHQMLCAACSRTLATTPANITGLAYCPASTPCAVSRALGSGVLGHNDMRDQVIRLLIRIGVSRTRIAEAVGLSAQRIHQVAKMG